MIYFIDVVLIFYLTQKIDDDAKFESSAASFPSVILLEKTTIPTTEVVCLVT